MLCLPNVSIKIKPAIIGDTVTGKSIRVVRTFLPLNLNFVIAQAANTPNIVFTATAIRVASRVRIVAFMVYSSVMALI